MEKRAVPPNEPKEPEEAASWREFLTYRIRLGLLPVAIAGLVATLTMSSAPGRTVTATMVAIPIALLALDILVPKLTQRSRAWLVLVVFLVSGFAGLLRLGLFAGPALVFTTGVLVAGLLLGRRAMYAVLACAVAETTFVAVGMISGALAPPVPADVAFTSPQPWLRAGLMAALAWWIMGAAVLHIVSALEGANRHLRDEQALRTKADRERRVAEDAAIQAQKLDAIGRLAAGVAHDFNNALMIIQMWNELARSSSSPKERADAAEGIAQASQQAGVLARQLLVLGRNEARAPRPMALVPFAREMQKTLRRVVPADVALSLEEAGAPHVVADETQLQQILVNLVVNARDALPAGGHVVVRAARAARTAPFAVAGATLPAGDWAFLEVEDSGTGMDAYVREHALEAFFTTKERGKGTGLGLATVRSIAEQSGGGVELDSEVGKGTRVRVWLPNVPAAEHHVSLAKMAPPPTDLRGRTLLVAEDNDEGRRLLERVLLEAGANVHSARDVDSALELLARHGSALDALITDAVMPGRTVRALLEAFAAARPDAPILVCSAYIGEELTRRGVEAGRFQLLPKPFAPRDLLRAVGGMLAKEP